MQKSLVQSIARSTAGQLLVNVAKKGTALGRSDHPGTVLPPISTVNPAAWAPCPSNANCGTTSSTTSGNYIKNFRAPRTPVENANIGRNFRIKERMNLQIRGEFVNILNRLEMPAPSTSNPQSAVTKNSLGIQTARFGVINTYLAPNTGYALPAVANQPYMEPRQGTLIARFSF